MYNVLRKFKAPDGSGPFDVDGTFETDDKRLAKSLMDAGIIEKKKSESKTDKQPDKEQEKEQEKQLSNKKKKSESKPK
ncbi:hypothetical protein [Terrihalobacillus insolitus]|uniref:hypothetical protein n=1 Tax=Terrihalobacillus insolitus TaxID=2950438 RepID=UPI0023400E96|nr:hypothetical protein [Terrihalobacillus insolitus]MDC3412532.1 hypothetical protein [Terrihalobacillus insolitus]